jgi:hypothetical protein
VCSIIPDGGDHVPSDFRAMRIPEPPEPVMYRPLRMQVKMAIPAAFWITRFGIFLVTRFGDRGSLAVEYESSSSSAGTR